MNCYEAAMEIPERDYRAENCCRGLSKGGFTQASPSPSMGEGWGEGEATAANRLRLALTPLPQGKRGHRGLEIVPRGLGGI